MRIPDRAGDYDRRITIERIKAAATTNAFGEVDKTLDANWETYATRWAHVEPVGGREQMRGGQVTPIALYRIRVRSDSTTRAIDTAMRIDLGGAKLNIERIHDKHTQRRELELAAREAQ